MPTTVTSSIGTSSRDYSLLQTWEDACPANLVTDDKIWRGECYNDSEFVLSTAVLVISGITADSTRYVELTTATGQSFADHADKATNRLAYDQSKGVGIRSTGNYVTVVSVTVDYTRFSKLQIKGGAVNTCPPLVFGLLNSSITRCIVHNQSSDANAYTVCTGDGYSTLFIRGGGSSRIVHAASGSLNNEFVNCGFVTTSDSSSPAKGLAIPYGTSVLTNCYIFKATDILDPGSASVTKNTCYTDGTETGFTTIAYDTTTGSGFEATTIASHDFRLKSTSGLIDVGTTNTAGSPDIIGTTRPQGSAYDIGPWEYASAAVAYIASHLYTRSQAVHRASRR